MQALMLQEPGRFQFVDDAEPGPPGPGEAVIRVRAVGICGTDYAGYRGTMPYFSYPRIPGHELGVEVVEVGTGVTNVSPGDRCCVEPYINCEKCPACRRGRTNCCEHNQTLGVHCDGGLRRLMTLPARKLHRSPNLTTAENALVETLAIGCHAIDRAAVAADDTVLVIGAGPIGLAAAEFARLAGSRVIVIDLNERRLDFVRRQIGIADVFTVAPTTDFVATLQDMTDGAMADVVIDATGSAESMSRSLSLCGFGGRLVYLGITQRTVSFPHSTVMHRRELTILASRNALSRDFPRIVGLIGEGKIDTKPWISQRLPFADTIEAFSELLEPSAAVIKVVIEMD